MNFAHNSDHIINDINRQLDWLKKVGDNEGNDLDSLLNKSKISKLKYPDRKVGERLTKIYQGYFDIRKKFKLQKRILAGKRSNARKYQSKLLENYMKQCKAWKKKNETWKKKNKASAKVPKQKKNQQGQGVDITGPQQSGLRVGHVNICSLTTTTKKDKVPFKFLNLQSYLKAFKFDVFVIGESQVIGIDVCELKIPGYEIKRLDREFTGNPPVDKVDGGGILVYVRSGRVKVEEVVLKNVLGSNLLQYIDLKLKYNNKTIHVVAVYNPPETGKMNAMLQTKAANYTGKVVGGLLYDYSQEQDVVILGDININILGGNNHEYQKCFGTSKGGLGFQQCIKEVTRWKSQTLIDHIYFKAENWNVSESGVSPSGPQNQIEGFADHKIIYCTLV